MEQANEVEERLKPRRSGTLVTGALLAALAKGKVLLAFLPKLLLTFGSMGLMIWAQAVRSGWLFGVGFVVCIFIHEMGHAFAIRRLGLQSSWPVFIPFVGAFITLKESDLQSPDVEAEIGIAGPRWGAAASLGSVVIYWLTHDRVWLAVAMTGFAINLFNLTPLRPLDGGRVAQLFSRRAWIVGAIILVGMFLWTWSPVLLLVALAGIPRALRGGTGEVALAVPAEKRLAYAAEYFGLASFLAIGFFLSHRLLTSHLA